MWRLQRTPRRLAGMSSIPLHVSVAWQLVKRWQWVGFIASFTTCPMSVFISQSTSNVGGTGSCVIAARRIHAVVYRSASLQAVPGPGWNLHTASIIAVHLTMSLRCLCSAPPPRAAHVPTTAADAPGQAAAAAPSVPAGPVSAEPMAPVAAAPPVRPCRHFLRLQLQAAGVQSLAGPQAAVPSTQDHPSTATRQLKCTCRAPRRAWKQCCRTQT